MMQTTLNNFVCQMENTCKSNCIIHFFNSVSVYIFFYHMLLSAKKYYVLNYFLKQLIFSR